MGLKSLASDLGINADQMSIEMLADSSAATGIASRRGLGKSEAHRGMPTMVARQSE